MSILVAKALSKSFDAHCALDTLDLSVAPGEIYCLLGANGAGKSTTINLFLGFLRPTSGQALVDGIDPCVDPIGTKRKLAYIPEIVMLYRNLTAVENLQYFSRLAGHEDHSDAALRDILIRSGLPADAADRRVGGFSKGMRQKVGIAIALAKEAKALLLDEPTSGLDPQASNEFSELIEQLGRQGVAILMATHDLFRAKESGTRAGIMRRGRLLAEVDMAEIGHADLEALYLNYMRN